MFRENKQRRRERNLWTFQEDDLLKKCLNYCERSNDKEGSKWSMIAVVFYLHGYFRNSDQCAQRWLRSLNPEIKKDEWSEDDDLLLMQLVDIHGCKSWRKINESLGRSDVNCRNRWRTLKSIRTPRQ
jgi:hypothetical protein